MENPAVGCGPLCGGESDICRLCLKTHEYYVNIFVSNEELKMPIGKAIEHLLVLEVAKGDSLPETVCCSCVTKLLEFRDFKEMCVISAKALVARLALMEAAKTRVRGGSIGEPRGENDDGGEDVPIKKEYSEGATVYVENTAIALDNQCGMKEELEDAVESMVGEIMENANEEQFPANAISSMESDPLDVGQVLQKRNNKRKGQAYDFEEIMERNITSLGEKLEKRSKTSRLANRFEDYRLQASSTALAADDEESVEALKEQIQVLKQSTARNTSPLSIEESVKSGLDLMNGEVKNLFSTVSSLQKEIYEMKQSHAADISSLKTQISELGNALRESSSGLHISRSTGVLSPTEQHSNMVEWVAGSGVMIRQRSKDTMEVVKGVHEWVQAFLYGVFSAETVANLCVKKKSNSRPNAQEIDPIVMEIARDQFKAWLHAQNKYAPEEITKLTKNLGSFVGDACLNRKGPRGSLRRVREARSAGVDVTAMLAEIKGNAAKAAAARAAAGKASRPYRRRGEKTGNAGAEKAAVSADGNMLAFSPSVTACPPPTTTMTSAGHQSTITHALLGKQQ